MSAAAQTKIFGLRIGVDPKILIGALFVGVALLFWYNSRSDDETAPAVAVHSETPAASAIALKPRAPIVRRAASTGGDRGMLRLRSIDATRGDVDPTLRLDLIARLQSVQPALGGRNLFELGPAPPPPGSALVAKAPILPPKPLPTGSPGQPGVNGPPPINIPLKYYGFVKPLGKGQAYRGLFLDGDNVLVGAEGEKLKLKYLVVELTPTSARLEDIEAKQGQTLPVVPVATIP